jgi:hypothetical protein
VHFGYFYLMILLASYCNLGMAYILSFFCESERTSQMIFNGILIPLQLCMSGYLFLLPTMSAWYVLLLMVKISSTIHCLLWLALSGTSGVATFVQ